MNAPPSLRQQFGNDFARSAFKRIDGKESMVGKFGQITQFDDGTFDVWFVGSNLAPLSGYRINALAEKYAQGADFHELSGEAWVQGRGREFALKGARLAEVKKKRRISEATREHLRSMREAQEAAA